MALTRNDCKECDGTGVVAGSQAHFKCPECAPTTKSDEALIRQLLEAAALPSMKTEAMLRQRDEAITAARARLEQP